MTVIKKDKLLEFAQQNKEEFDMLEVDPQIWERINRAQPSMPKKSKVHPMLLRAAAAIILFSMAWWLGHTYDVNPSKSFTEQVKDEKIEKQIPALAEVEKVYGAQVDVLLTKVDEKLSSQPQLREELYTDLADLDSTYAQYKTELNTAHATEDVVQAMIQIYKMKVEILQELLDELQRKEQNTHQHETEINL